MMIHWSMPIWNGTEPTRQLPADALKERLCSKMAADYLEIALIGPDGQQISTNAKLCRSDRAP